MFIVAKTSASVPAVLGRRFQIGATLLREQWLSKLLAEFVQIMPLVVMPRKRQPSELQKDKQTDCPGTCENNYSAKPNASTTQNRIDRGAIHTNARSKTQLLVVCDQTYCPVN